MPTLEPLLQVQFGFCELKTSAELSQGLPANYSDYSAITGQWQDPAATLAACTGHLALFCAANKRPKDANMLSIAFVLTLACWLLAAVPFISGYTGAPLGTSSSGAPMTGPTVMAADRGL